MEPLEITIIVLSAVVGTLLVIAIAALAWWWSRRRDLEYAAIAFEESLDTSVRSKRPPPVQEKQQSALMNARFYLRSSQYEMKEAMYEIGARPNKFHFLVRKQRNQHLLGMVPKGKNCLLPIHSNATRIAIRTVVCSFKHAYVMPTLEADFLPGRDLLLTFRKFSARDGSLKDKIYHCKPNKRYAEKYARGTSLKPKMIANYGRQILEGLLCFKSYKFPYPHLHTGNVVIDDGVCRLTDYENSLMGLKPYHADVLKTTTSGASPEAICFGCVLYEMAIGEPLESPKRITSLPNVCPEAIQQILRSIFLGEPTVATLEDLAAHPFFDVNVIEDSDETDIDSTGQEVIRGAGPGDGSKQQVKSKRKPRSTASSSTSNSSPMDVRRSQSNSSMSSSLSSSVSSSLSSSSVTSSSLSTSISSKAPPPPPPPAIGTAPPPPPVAAPSAPSASSGRSNLLADIQRGKKLKRAAAVNDRSAPKV